MHQTKAACVKSHWGGARSKSKSQPQNTSVTLSVLALHKSIKASNKSCLREISLGWCVTQSMSQPHSINITLSTWTLASFTKLTDKGSHGTKLLLTEQLSSHNGCKCEPQNSFHHLAKPATTDRKPWGVSVMNKSAFITESRLVVGWHSQEATG